MSAPRSALSYDPMEPMPPQEADWTCSACSLAWMNRALGIMAATDELAAVERIGCPENINPEWGLMDASGARLVQCLREEGAPAFSCWPTFDDAVRMAREWPMLIGGVGWYHWVGVRVSGDFNLILANSARGWMGIFDNLLADDWERLGPFAAVPVPLLRNFPPIPTS